MRSGSKRLSIRMVGRRTIVLGMIACAALFVYGPTLVVPFVGDDALRANIDGWLAVHHASLLDAFRSELVREDLVAGRFHPAFVALTLLEMHVVHQAFPLKLFQLLAVAVNVVTLFVVVRELTGSAERALAAAAWSILTLQVRAIYDATSGDTLHLQLTLEAGLLGVGFLAIACRQRRFRWIGYAASIVSFATAIALYELMLVMIFPLALLCVTKTGGRTVHRFLLALPFVVIAAVEVVALVFIRRTYPPGTGSFYALAFGMPFAHAVANQLVSTLPFVYELVDPQRIFHASGTFWFLAAVILSAVFVTLLCWHKSGIRASTENRSDLVMLRTTGCSLMLTGVIVAASPVYQHQISIGLPYAPVYFQGFGLAILAVAGSSYRIVMPSLPARSARAAYVVLVLALFVSNIVVARDMSSSGDVRKTIVDGLSHGAANDVPSGSLVFLDRSYYWVNDNSTYGNDETRGPVLWDSTYFYRLWSGRTWRTRKLSAERLGVGEEAFEIRSGANDRRRGTLIVQRVRGRGAGVPPAIVDATIFQRGLPDNAPPAPAIASTFADADFRLLRSAASWRLSAFEPHCDALPNDALIANAPSTARLIYGRGIDEAEDDGAARGRWAGPLAELRFVNETSRRLVVTFRASLQTIGRPRGIVVITTPYDRQSIYLASNRRALRFVMPVAARSNVVLRLETDAVDVAIAGDTRDLRYRIVDATIADDAGCAAADISSASRPQTR